MKKGLAVVALVVAGLLCGAACGAGGTSSSSTSDRLVGVWGSGDSSNVSVRLSVSADGTRVMTFDAYGMNHDVYTGGTVHGDTIVFRATRFGDVTLTRTGKTHLSWKAPDAGNPYFLSLMLSEL